MDTNDICEVVPSGSHTFDVVLKAPDGQRFTVDSLLVQLDATVIARRVGNIVQAWAQATGLSEREKDTLKRALNLARTAAKTFANLEAPGGLSSLVMEVAELDAIELKLT